MWSTEYSSHPQKESEPHAKIRNPRTFSQQSTVLNKYIAGPVITLLPCSNMLNLLVADDVGQVKGIKVKSYPTSFRLELTIPMIFQL